MLRIYLAAPIGANDEGRDGRVKTAVIAGCELLASGFAPWVPHHWPASAPDEIHMGVVGYEGMMTLCFSFLRVCDALLRLPGRSPGADREVALAESLGIPVFYSLAALAEWGRNVARCDAADEVKQDKIHAERARLRALVVDLRAEYRALPEETPEEARDAARWAIQKAEHEERLLARQERGEPVRRA